MSLRPEPARWFEVLVLRDDLTASLDVLARSARVELQSHGKTRAPLLLPESRELLAEFEELESRYAPYWPAPRAREPDVRREPRVMLQDALQCLRGWESEARDLVDTLEALSREREDLKLLLALLRHADDALPDLEALSSAGPMLETCLYRLAGDEWPKSLPATVITERLNTPQHAFLLAIGLPAEIGELEQQLQALKARRVRLPADLPVTAGEASVVTRQRIDDADRRIHELRAALEALDERCDIAGALADARFVEWYVVNVPDLESTENFAWITGWTSEPDEEALLRLLADRNIKGLLRISAPPYGFDPPLLLRNPAWMRPFEVFTGMLGVPSAGEADPTRIVAIASPLMFGYMFGDVGHGLVLVVTGLILQWQYPALRLLIAGGAVSVVFGFLFGSVFALETVIEPLWMHPMQEPLLMFVVPMAGGAVLLLIGMFLDALQAYWQQKGRHWWETGAGFALCYLGLLASIVDPRFLFVALTGAAWFIIGHGIVAPGRRLAAAGQAAVEFLESLVQLVINTISFVRVGAFALAHAGLCMAVVGVAEAPASTAAKVVILILGNLLIIALEGLVVGIQTTRLILFEFFIRFLHAEGRPFKPMVPAVPALPGKQRRPQ